MALPSNSSDSSESFRVNGEERGEPVEQGSRSVDEVFSLVYEELRRLARYMLRNDPGATLSSRSILHQAWMKLKDSPQLANLERDHFKAVAAKAMRQVLVEAARKRNSQKRGGAGAVLFVTLDDSAGKAESTSAEVLALDAALDKLAEWSPRQAEMVECRFFRGLSVAETAEAMHISEASIARDWRAARAWLAVEMRHGGE